MVLIAPSSQQPSTIPPPPIAAVLSTSGLEDDIRDTFVLPICMCEKTRTLDATIVKDMELLDAVDDDGVAILDRVFGGGAETDDNVLGKVMRSEMAKYYTDDARFIEDTQTILRAWNGTTESITDKSNDSPRQSMDNMFALWNELRNDKDFKDKYTYMDWESLLFLNDNQTFLQVLSVYNLIAPVLALLVPCIICIVPFFIMLSRGYTISFSKYVELLKTVASNHAVTKVFTGFSGMTVQQRIYSAMSAGFYFMSLYQNTQICLKFYANMFKIHDKLFEIRDFAKRVGDEMDLFLEHSGPLASYGKFNDNVRAHRQVLTKMHTVLADIPPCTVSYSKLLDMGKVLKWFYVMHTGEEFHQSMLFSLGFIGYTKNMQGVQHNVRTNKMNYGVLMSADTVPVADEKKMKKNKKKGKKACERREKQDAMKVSGVFHPSVSDGGAVKNDVVLKKDCVITGPNASGKTTMLKSLFLSILFTQQYGCGFYDTCAFVPYTHLHCYLNIPDTSGRDSLFQSESRKCKDILDSIQKDGTTARHFCLFDELYSGTNPTEAVKCGYAYLSHLSETENIHYVLTTHYPQLCEKLKEKQGLLTYRMCVDVPKESREPIIYTYKIEDGINEVDGGVEVLRQMQYPTSILNKMDE